MSDVLHSSCKVVTTRKRHRCPGCAITWPAGTEMFKVVGVDMGTIFSTYWCSPCDNLLRGDEDTATMPDGVIRDEDIPAWEAECLKEYGKLPYAPAEAEEGEAQ